MLMFNICYLDTSDKVKAHLKKEWLKFKQNTFVIKLTCRGFLCKKFLLTSSKLIFLMYLFSHYDYKMFCNFKEN